MKRRVYGGPANGRWLGFDGPELRLPQAPVLRAIVEDHPAAASDLRVDIYEPVLHVTSREDAADIITPAWRLK